jgi:predicted transcriptional regulator
MYSMSVLTINRLDQKTDVSTEKHVVKRIYRCKADIIAAILQAAASGEVTKSALYYNSFLTYHRLREYMILLLGNELIEYIDYKDKIVYKRQIKAYACYVLTLE